MLKLTNVLVFLQLTSKMTANTLLPYLQSYWNTTYITDQAPDYWNHGLIYVPGLPIGPKPEDIFPAWVTKEESSTTDYEIDVEDQATYIIPLTTNSTIITTVSDKEEIIANAIVQNIAVTADSESTTMTQLTVALESTVVDNNKKRNKTESSALTTDTTQLPIKAYLDEVVPVIRAIEGETSTDPFSAFFRKMIIVLASKTLPDLQYFIKQFHDYVSMLLTTGQLGKLGMATNSYIATRLLLLDTYPMEPLREYLNKLQLKFANRSKELPKDVNKIINYMDDTYDETEEDAMQAVLREAILFPKTKNYHKVAQGFVDYVFIKPMLRVMGTSRGNVLFNMIQKAIIKHNNVVRTTAKTPMVFPPFRSRITENSRHYRRNFESTQKIRHKSLNRKTEEDKPRRRKDEDTSLSKYYSSSESSEWTSSTEVKEGSLRIIRKNNPLKNKNIVNFKYKKSRHAVQRTLRKNKLKKVLRKLRSEYNQQHSPHKFYNHGQGSYDNQNVLETMIENGGNDFNATESSDNETLLKAKLYDSFKSKDSENFNIFTTMKYRNAAVVKKQHNNGNYDIKRLLRRSIYKLAKKLLNK